VTFAVAVSAVSPGVGTPTGVLTFTDGVAELGTANLNNGVASFSSSALAVGSHSVTVSYSGDSSFLASMSTALTQVVNKAGTATGSSSLTNLSVFGQLVTVTASVGTVGPGVGIPSGTVTFTDGATVVGTAALSNGSATFTTGTLGVGSHSITASYGGGGNFLGSASGAVTQLVSKASTTTTITSVSPNPVVVGQPVKVSFSITPNAPGGGMLTGTVTVSDGAGASCVATLPATSCSLTSATVGSRTLTATYSGDASFSASWGTSAQRELVTYVFTGFFSPLAPAGTLFNPSNSGTGTLGHGIPIKWSLQDGVGNPSPPEFDGCSRGDFESNLLGSNPPGKQPFSICRRAAPKAGALSELVQVNSSSTGTRQPASPAVAIPSCCSLMTGRPRRRRPSF